MTLTRQATRKDLDTIIDWAAHEGWNPGLDDAGPFWAADPQGYFVIEHRGTLLAAISLVRHQPDFAFLGFYIVAPDARGKGLGWSLWNHALQSVEGATVALDGVVAQQDNYRKSGFAYAHANIRYGGKVAAVNMHTSAIVVAAHVPIQDLLAYDAKHNPTPREHFMREWLADTNTRHSLAWVEGGVLKGLGTIRACRSGFKIGPLFADNADVANRLFSALVSRIGGGDVFLDIPEHNADAKALCERYGLTPVFETARMYRGQMPDLPLDKIYGITTFELG